MKLSLALAVTLSALASYAQVGTPIYKGDKVAMKYSFTQLTIKPDGTYLSQQIFKRADISAESAKRHSLMITGQQFTKEAPVSVVPLNDTVFQMYKMRYPKLVKAFVYTYKTQTETITQIIGDLQNPYMHTVNSVTTDLNGNITQQLILTPNTN